jgi:hypothetical protein
MSPQERQEIAAALLGEIDWYSEVEGYCRCPGFEKHTTPDGERDCRVLLDGVPTISCFHQSCSKWIEAYNTSLRTQIGAEEETKKPVKRKKVDPEWIRAVRFADRVKEKFPQIFQPDSPWWKGPELLKRGLGIEESREQFWKLFEPKDLLWIGWCRDSGVKGLGHFHPMSYWRKQKAFYPFTCTGTFRVNHGHARSAGNILNQCYDVIEFDKLSPDPRENQLRSIALFFYLAEQNRLNLRIIVDTGNKSIHFWIDHQEQFANQFFIAFLKALGADTNGFKSAQPVRFPGVYRPETLRPQTILTL